MITLYGYGPGLGLPDFSPFVTKVDCYLRMAGIEFESVACLDSLTKTKLIARNPKRKLPYIEDGDRLVADSTFILRYLEETYGALPGGEFSLEQKAAAHLASKAIEDNLYWCMVHARWQNGWAEYKNLLFGNLPPPLRQVIAPLARRQVLKALHYQGTGRHSDAEVLTIAEGIVWSLADLLGAKPYFLGDRPSAFDATAYAFLAPLILVPQDNPMATMARRFDNLREFCERMQAAYYA